MFSFKFSAQPTHKIPPPPKKNTKKTRWVKLNRMVDLDQTKMVKGLMLPILCIHYFDVVRVWSLMLVGISLKVYAVKGHPIWRALLCH